MGSASLFALAGVPAVAIAAAPADPDAELHRLCEAYWRLREEADALEARHNAVIDEVDQVAPHPATFFDSGIDWVEHMNAPAQRAALEANAAEMSRRGADVFDDETSAISDRLLAASGAVLARRAATIEGMLAKARVAADDCQCPVAELESGDVEARAFVSLWRDIEALAAAG